MGRCSKDKRDAYYRLAKEQNWRARSAFKLIQLDEQFDLFSYEEPEKCTRVVDLCAAPGSWSQVLSRVLIKGESFGRRKWVEKMSNFQSDAEKRSASIVTESEIKGQSESQTETLIEKDMTNLNLAGVGVDDHSNTKDETTKPEITQHQPPTQPSLQPRKNVKIVAIDLQPMASLPGITQLKADITHPSTVPLLLRALDIDIDLDPSQPISQTSLLVDLVISDGAPDVTGLHDLDIYIQASLLYSALSLAIKVLRPGGKFVAKIFRGKDCDLIYAQLKTCFDTVTVAKPRSSRASSIEAFVVCEGFKGIRVDPWVQGQDADADAVDNVAEARNNSEDEGEGRCVEVLPTRTAREDGVTILEFPKDQSTRLNRWMAPFLACGDLDAYDADATYKLPPDYVSLPPVQPPTAPPYKEALERRRAEGGLYGKTKK